MAWPFRSQRKFLWQELPWMALLSHRKKRRIVVTTDGAWMMTIAYRGPDMELRSAGDRFRYSALMNNIIRQLGTGYVVWTDELRVPWPHYPADPEDGWPDAASELYNAEARENFAAGGHFMSRCWMTILYRPQAESLNRLTRQLIEFDPEEDNAPYAQELDHFVSMVERVVGMLRPWMPYVEVLENGALLTYLKTHISTNLNNVADMEFDEQLPGSLVDMPFEGGMRPKLGHDHDRWSVYPISVHNYVTTAIEAAVLRKLRALPHPVRWRRVVRWIGQDRHEANKELARAWGKAAAARKPVGVQALEAMTKESALRINPEADRALVEAEAAQVELGQGLVSRGYLTQAIIVYVPRKPALEAMVKEILASLRTDRVPVSAVLKPAIERAVDRLGLAAPFEMRPVREIESALCAEGLVAEIETFNAAEVIKGAIPGEVWSDVTRHGVNSAVASGFMPFDGTWSGNPTNPRLGGPCIMQARTNGNEPFFLNLHAKGQLGHFLVLGGSRKGKTTLFNALRLQHMRYPGAQCFGIDMNRGGMVTTLAMGGAYVEVGAPGNALQPLRYIRDRWWRERSHDWLIDYLSSVDPERARDPRVSDELTNALSRAAETIPDHKRSMTAFVAGANDLWIKSALRKFTADGEYGDVFDGINQHVYDQPVVTFDITDVTGRTQLLPPLVAYLFNLMRARANPEKPMLFLGDEAWNMLRPPFSTRLEVQFRAWASQNIQAGLASQSVLDPILSDIAHVIAINCPTRIYLPDPGMARRGTKEKPAEADALEQLGLRESEISALATAGGYQYLVQQNLEDPREGSGVRFIDLNLTPVQLALCGMTDSASVKMAREVLTEYGSDNFLSGVLSRLGFYAEAARVRRSFSTAAE